MCVKQYTTTLKTEEKKAKKKKKEPAFSNPICSLRDKLLFHRYIVYDYFDCHSLREVYQSKCKVESGQEIDEMSGNYELIHRVSHLLPKLVVTLIQSR